jgi:hypothetical protein
MRNNNKDNLNRLHWTLGGIYWFYLIPVRNRTPSFSIFYQWERSIWRTWNIAPLVLSTILKDFFTSFIVESKILQNHWLRNYFVKLVDRGECKIIGTRLTMFGRQIVEFLHKRTRRICSLLAFGKLTSSGFFHC